ncbi:probable WRKY transcription factor 32 isoform X2 [Malania oleifera]|uniref:probable WRKY transcription factor 32 isoform X2 n=1 Tax=Malania oleifera TaxID=397392 RepID=UPI0025AECC63|nr:probable WRKY transcription factor 32 isoform X2 [Malania oleifera]
MAESQSFEALRVEKLKPNEEEEQEEEGEEEEEGDDDEEEEEEDGAESEDEQRQVHEVQRVEGEFRDSQLQSLAEPSSPPQSANDVQSGLVSSSQLLSELPVNCAAESTESAQFKEQVGVSHQEVLASETALTVQAQTQNQLQQSGCPTTQSEFSPASVTEPISPAQSPTVPEQQLSLALHINGGCTPEMDRQNSLEKTISTTHVKMPSADGYNWRKYGQKQVKSPKGSRSYYKCTYSDCSVKKIECCDDSGGVIEVIYRGQHNHEPPRMINSVREKSTQETPPLRERKRENSNGSDGSVDIKVEEEHVNEPEPKRRAKKSSLEYSGSPLKPGKKPKFVVHAAGDVGISGDGYRWRKYGQKMVKGNPHPRNYYRCTSAGCPVRKHIENAVDNTNAVIITYKGIHDHDMPVPKKRHGPPSAPLVAAAAPASMNNLQFKKTEALQNDMTSTQWSVDTEGELTGEALDLGGEKAIESARTLLSIGFEIKPC